MEAGFLQPFAESHESNEKNPGLGDSFGDDILPSYVGIVINHSKDPYESTSLMIM